MALITSSLSKSILTNSITSLLRNGEPKPNLCRVSSVLRHSFDTDRMRHLATQPNVNELPPPAKFIKLSEGTVEDFKAAQEHFSIVASTKNTVDRWINMIEVNNNF